MDRVIAPNRFETWTWNKPIIGRKFKMPGSGRVCVIISFEQTSKSSLGWYKVVYKYATTKGLNDYHKQKS